MNSNNFEKYIVIDEYSSTPKYLQLSNSIIKAIESGVLNKDDALPSINELTYCFDISRDTAEKGYRYLKEKKIILSYPGKGYYVNDVKHKIRFKIFLLFNKLSAHKKIIYDSLIENLGDDVLIDLYIYNNDFLLFKKLILNKRTDYTHFVIIPYLINDGNDVHEVLKEISKEKLIILDRRLPFLEGAFSSVYENFEKDIYQVLKQALENLSKYSTLKMIVPKDSYFPKEIVRGFKFFCNQYAFNYVIVEDISNEIIKADEVYINLIEDDLVTLIEKILSKGLSIGKDVGVISYNEAPLKKLLLNGITTISTDFKKMGEMVAQLIVSNKQAHLEVPFYLNLRLSL